MLSFTKALVAEIERIQEAHHHQRHELQQQPFSQSVSWIYRLWRSFSAWIW